MSSCSPIQTVPDSGIMPALGEIPDAMNDFYSQVMATRPGLSAHVPQADVSDVSSDVTTEDVKVYTSLSDSRKSSCASPPNPAINRTTSSSSADTVDIRSWRERHPRNWSSHDIVNWIYFVCSRSDKLDCYKIRGENFNSLSGHQLCQMMRKDFLRLEPNYGGDLYDCFSKLLETAQFKAPEYADLCLLEEISSVLPPSPTPLEDNSAMWSSTIPPEDRDQEMDLSACSMLNFELESSMGPGNGIVFIGDKQYDYISDDGFEDIQTPHNCGGEESGYGSDGSTCNSPREGIFPQPPPAHSNHPPIAMAFHSLPYQHQMPAVATALTSPRPAHAPSHEGHVFQLASPAPPTTTTSSGKQRGRPRRENGATGASGTRGRKHGQTTKGHHLWEFIRDTINDARYNPDYIKWENKEQGIFRIVNSGEIARMWGRTKNNSTMTYEKFSRAMRDYYKTNILRRVGTRKLVYAFGSKVFPFRDASSGSLHWR